VTELVRYEVAGSVATITLDNPDRRNAWSLAMERQYAAVLDRATADSDVRAIVVTGAGGNFCPGPDAADLAEVAGGTGLDRSGQPHVHHALTVPKPMIAAVEGLCAGVGLLQILMCDVRVVAAGARVSTAYARRGLPAEHGVAWLLPRLIGPERALDLLLSGRTLDTDEVLAVGLASRTCPRGEARRHAAAYASELAERSSPRSMAAIKRQVWGDLDRSYRAAMAGSDALTDRFNSANADFVEGMLSFVERRLPRFAPLDPDEPLPSLEYGQ
jgi:enoyl-CoA hydratase/carnithine racemase